MAFPARDLESEVIRADQIAQALSGTNVAKVDWCQLVERTIDLLDELRKQFTGHNPLDLKWWIKQVLDQVITALHKWHDANCGHKAAKSS